MPADINLQVPCSTKIAHPAKYCIGPCSEALHLQSRSRQDESTSLTAKVVARDHCLVGGRLASLPSSESCKAVLSERQGKAEACVKLMWRQVKEGPSSTVVEYKVEVGGMVVRG